MGVGASFTFVDTCRRFNRKSTSAQYAITLTTPRSDEEEEMGLPTPMDVSSLVECELCFLYFKKAFMCKTCRNTICGGCVGEYDSKTCAFCSSPMSLEEIFPRDTRIRQRALPAGLPAVGTPIRIGDDFDTLKRKLLPFEEAPHAGQQSNSGDDYDYDYDSGDGADGGDDGRFDGEGGRSGMRQISDALRESADELKSEEAAPLDADDERQGGADGEQHGGETEVPKRAENTGDVSGEGVPPAKEEKPLGLDDVEQLGMSRALPIEIESPVR